MLSIQGVYCGSTVLGIPDLTVREFTEGEAHVKSFLPACLGLTRGCVILPGHESSKGCADFHMTPDLIRRPEIACSYIVEVKYARRNATESEMAALKAQAAGRLRRYAADGRVQRTKGGTQDFASSPLVFRGREPECSEVEP